MTRLEVEEAAIRVLGQMEQRVNAVAARYGKTSEEYADVLKSFAGALMSLLRLGGKVMPDGELSLVSASFMTYGVIWHPRYEFSKPDELLGSWQIHS